MSEQKTKMDSRIRYIETCLKEMGKLTISDSTMFRVYKNDLMKMVKLIVKGGDCSTCEFRKFR